MAEHTPSSKQKKDLHSLLDKIEAEDSVASRERHTVRSSQLCKSKAANSQSALYSSLVAIRILLQRSFSKPHQGRGNEKEDEEEISHVMKMLVNARQKLCGMKEGKTMEIDCDTSEFREEEIQLEYEACRENWKLVLNKRYHDIRLHSGMTVKSERRLKVMDLTFWDQVEAVVSNEKILQHGDNANAEIGGSTGEKLIRNDSKTCAANLFNDEKVYQHMLKDFITAGASGAELAQERIKRAQEKKRKRTKEVDRRASKGRKIRYTVHPKLTNFCFPVKRPDTGGVEVDDWFRSLFGGVADKSNFKQN